MIFYRCGYKYQLTQDYTVQLSGLAVWKNVSLDFIELSAEGKLTVKAGYAWDGPSGPSFDTVNFMRGSLVHDALYQLLGEKLIGFSNRVRADEILREICREDGMSAFRAWYVYQAVRVFGHDVAKAADAPPHKAGKCGKL